jgi:hypothetical protein
MVFHGKVLRLIRLASPNHRQQKTAGDQTRRFDETAEKGLHCDHYGTLLDIAGDVNTFW